MGWLVLLLAGWTAHAAVIKGVIVDNYTGRPLTRTLCVLTPLQGTREASLSVRSGGSGQFTFFDLAPGAYLLTCSRRGFAPLRYGQKTWNAPPAPIVLDADTAPFYTLRMRRYGGIAGTIQDENEAGFADVDVYAYKASRPSRQVAKTRTDDRGNYRLGELEPGPYLLRTGTQQLEDGTGLLPTFHREALVPEDARTVEVALEEDSRFVSVRPAYGKLLRLKGQAFAPGGPVQVTLTSPVGSTTTVADGLGYFSFEQLAPGPYELLATFKAPSGTLADWREVYLDRDNDNVGLTVGRLAEAQIQVGDQGAKRAAATVFVRRKDLDGEGPAQALTARRDKLELLPGRWEVRAVTGTEMYPVSVQVAGPARRGDTWSEFRLTRNAFVRIQVVVSNKPGTVTGRVMRAANEAAIGAAVFLEAWDPDTGKRLGDLRATVADAKGHYRFEGLAPGSYRVLSTFEFEDPDERQMVAGRLIRISESEAFQQDLDLWVQP